jgi:hypothetical protein
MISELHFLFFCFIPHFDVSLSLCVVCVDRLKKTWNAVALEVYSLDVYVWRSWVVCFNPVKDTSWYNSNEPSRKLLAQRNIGLVSFITEINKRTESQAI